MKNKAFMYFLFVAILLFIVVSYGTGADPSAPAFVAGQILAEPGSGKLLAVDGISSEAVYIVRLQDVPLGSYRGEIPRLEATSPAALASRKLDISSAASVAYRDYLAAKQSQFLATAEKNLQREVEPIYQYDITYNGVAITMTEAEAAMVAKQPGVTSVQRDQWRQKHTDVTPSFVGATSIWDGGGVDGAGTKGDGVVVGIVDTGIWPEHPSFADNGNFPVPKDWHGGCSLPDDGSQAYGCNNKMIGAKHFLTGYKIVSYGYDGLFDSARDDDGHGTHTASTAAGNEAVSVNLLNINRGTLSGIAPRAHVAAYKALGPRGGVTSDLVAAIDEAVGDGVDVINYSIGSTNPGNPWSDPDALAFLAARDAGVFVATSAGNSGPYVETIGSPGNAPWITTVGASSSNRHFISDITLSGPGTPPTGLYGASVTKGVTNFNLVDARGIGDSKGDASGKCLNPFNSGTFDAHDVVLCQRGEVARVARGDFVLAGGGGGVILYNPDQQGLATDNFVIPAVHVENDTGQIITDYIQRYPGDVTTSFTQGQKTMDNDPRVTADMMASFSSRGPNTAVLDIIKPNVTAPGVQILAGASPEHDGEGAQGELFQSIQGTSMSSPHVAGAGALIRAVHPNWSPSEIESALMTTADTDHVKENGLTKADPFDMGGGRIDLLVAAKAPLVLHETVDKYRAASPAVSGDPKTLNIASMGNSNCLVRCAWIRNVRNATNQAMTWKASVSGLSGTVSPAQFTLDPGTAQELTVAVDAISLPEKEWAYGQVDLVPQGSNNTIDSMPSTHLPIAVKGNHVTIDTRRDAGSYLMEDLNLPPASDLIFDPHGFVAGGDSQISLKQYLPSGNPYEDLDQVWWKLIDMPSNSIRFVNEILESTALDAGLFVAFDGNGNGRPDREEEICGSSDSSWNEYCNIDMPHTGGWWVLVQNREASGWGVTDNIRLSTAFVSLDDAGNMTIDSSISELALDNVDVRVKYDLINTYEGQAWYGAFSVGTTPSSHGDVGRVNIDLYRLGDDVVKTADTSTAAPGNTVSYAIEVKSNVLDEDVDYEIVDKIPDGMTYVEGSGQASSGSVSVRNNSVFWRGTLANPNSPRAIYNLSTSTEDEMCHTPARLGGGYINLEDEGFKTEEDVKGNDVAYTYSVGQPVNFYGQEYPELTFTDDGFVIFDFDSSYAFPAGQAQLIPQASKPTNVAAMLWQDMEIVYNAVANRGVTVAHTKDLETIIVEYDDVQIVGKPNETYDFEIIVNRTVDGAPGAYEIVFAYDNLQGSLAGPLTIGIENSLGDVATALVNQGSAEGVFSDGFMVCLDAVLPMFDLVTISYDVTVNNDVKSETVLVNNAISTTSTVGSKIATASAVVTVRRNDVFLPITGDMTQ
jgi:uncharacterized repeat protein (TIGR01451 family)